MPIGAVSIFWTEWRQIKIDLISMLFSYYNNALKVLSHETANTENG
jgi:hypothetical protein